MKKVLLFLAWMVVGSLGTLMAQEAQEAASQQEVREPIGQHPWKETNPVTPEVSNWSLYLLGGFNCFDGDYTSEKKHEVNAPTVGLGFEYNFNPTWGIGGEYQFRHYAVMGNGKNNTVDGKLLNGIMHQIDAYITFDIFNCWRPMNRYKLFALNLMVGGGYMWYKNDRFYPNTYKMMPDGVTMRQPETYAQNTKNEEPQKMDKYKGDAIFFGGAEFEFNVSHSISLGLRAVYNYSCHDEWDGRARGNNNDGIFDVTAMLRWKIQAKKKTHVRNICSYAILDKMVAEQNYVPYVPQKDTVVFYHKDTVVMKNIVQVAEFKDDDYGYVYFANDMADLDNQALVIIQQYANKMLRNKDLYAVIVGYCDATGTPEYNAPLGEQRAHNVAEEMIEEYGVPADHILPIGRGQIINGRRSGAYSPNRRAEIRLMNKKEFEKTAGRYNAANSEDIKAIRNANGQEVVIEEKASLSQLARKYYNNPNCWVYSFIANQETMLTPNSLEEGTFVIIPDLNENQRLMTREGAAELYKRVK